MMLVQQRQSAYPELETLPEQSHPSAVERNVAILDLLLGLPLLLFLPRPLIQTFPHGGNFPSVGDWHIGIPLLVAMAGLLPAGVLLLYQRRGLAGRFQCLAALGALGFLVTIAYYFLVYGVHFYFLLHNLLTVAVVLLCLGVLSSPWLVLRLPSPLHYLRERRTQIPSFPTLTRHPIERVIASLDLLGGLLLGIGALVPSVKYPGYVGSPIFWQQSFPQLVIAVGLMGAGSLLLLRQRHLAYLFQTLAAVATTLLGLIFFIVEIFPFASLDSLWRAWPQLVLGLILILLPFGLRDLTRNQE